MHGTDSRLTTITWTLNVCLNLTETEVKGNLGAILGSSLGCIRSILLRSAESHFTSR